jgi:hypothetical protein
MHVETPRKAFLNRLIVHGGNPPSSPTDDFTPNVVRSVADSAALWSFADHKSVAITRKSSRPRERSAQILAVALLSSYCPARRISAYGYKPVESDQLEGRRHCTVDSYTYLNERGTKLRRNSSRRACCAKGRVYEDVGGHQAPSVRIRQTHRPSRPRSLMKKEATDLCEKKVKGMLNKSNNSYQYYRV